MKKIFLSVIFCLPILASKNLSAQTMDSMNVANSYLNSNSNSTSGSNKMLIMGNAEGIFVLDSSSANFTDVNFKPIFLWMLSDKLFIEAEAEIETGDGEAHLGLEYANMCYKLNDYMTIHAGRFLQKFGAYRGRNGEAFLNRQPTKPVGFGDGGIGPMNEVGVGLQGGLPFGAMKLNYDFYVSNGVELLTDSANVGQFEYEAYLDNNKNKAYGGRIGILPFSNSCVELGVSLERNDKTGEVGSEFANIGSTMMAFDGSFFHKISPLKGTFRLLGEFKNQNTDEINLASDSGGFYAFKNYSSCFYVGASFRPDLLKNKCLRNFEIAGRYSQFNPPVDAPWGGPQRTQTSISIDYWLHWNTLVKFCYQMQTDTPNQFIAQAVFGF